MKVDSGSVLGFLGKIQNAPAELSQVLNVGYLLIAIGALLVVIGFLGCCGAVRESQCMLLLVGPVRRRGDAAAGQRRVTRVCVFSSSS